MSASNNSNNDNPPPPSLAATLPNNNSNDDSQSHGSSKRVMSTPYSCPKNETNAAWLGRIRDVQMQNKELAERVRQHADEAASRTMQAKKMSGVAHRTHNAKTSTYVAMSTASPAFMSAAPGGGASTTLFSRGHQASVLDSIFGAPRSAANAPVTAPVPAQSNNNNNNNNNAGGTLSGISNFFGFGSSSAVPPAQQPQPQQQQQIELERMQRRHEASAQQRQEACDALMSKMDNDDMALEEAYAPPTEQQIKSAPMTAQRPDAWFTSSNQAGFGGGGANARRVQEQQQAIAASSHHTTVTETEEQQALRMLQAAPKDDEEAASKFGVYEKFSDKLVKIRGDFDKLMAETVTTMPPLMRQDVDRIKVKRLDSNEARGIHDESSNWFAHQMFRQASKNADAIAEISDDVSARMRVLANQTDLACPVCLTNYAGGPKTDDDDSGQGSNLPEDEELVERLVWPCAHSTCHACYKQLQAVLGARISCPLCRSDVMVELLSRQ
jgi:hypothetical protein